MNYWRHRIMCDVLEEMRKCSGSANYAALPGLIEEVQIMGNKMEAALSYQKDTEKLHDKRKKLEKEVKKLQAKVDKLKKKLTPPTAL